MIKYITLIILVPCVCFANLTDTGEEIDSCSTDSLWNLVPGACFWKTVQNAEVDLGVFYEYINWRISSSSSEINLADSKSETTYNRQNEIQASSYPESYLKECFNDVCEESDLSCKKRVIYEAALRTGDIEVIRTFLECGGDPNMQEGYGDYGEDIPSGRKWTLLHMASNLGFLNIVELLIQYGAEVSITDASGRIPLYRAVIPCHNFQETLKIVSVVYENGADINHRDNFNETPLYNAITYACPVGNKLEMIEYLVSLGAKTDIKNNKGWSPLDTAIWINDEATSGHTPIVEFLEGRDRRRDIFSLEQQ